MSKRHYLKCDPPYYAKVEQGLKSFEIRYNDRGYKVQDQLVLLEFVEGSFTGRNCEMVVTDIVADYIGLAPAFCAMSFANVTPGQRLSPEQCEALHQQS